MKTFFQAISKSALLLVVAFLFLNAGNKTDKKDSLDDPYLWLEENQGERALDWVKAHDETTMNDFKDDPNFIKFQNEASEILNAKDKIPFGSFAGGFVDNFWQDDEHIRGILRRTTLEDYKKLEPRWETLLDIDKLNKDEGKSWVFKGSECLSPKHERCLISLSLGGKDAVFTREFDYKTKSFVEDGFYLKEAKSDVAWYDDNTLIVATDFGPGSLTDSKYPRIVKLWKRGTDLSKARVIFQGEKTDVSAGGYVSFREDGNNFLVTRYISRWDMQSWLVDKNLKKFETLIPKDADIKGFFKGYMLVFLSSDWSNIPAGSLVAIKTNDIKAKDLSKIEIVFRSDEKNTVTGAYTSKDYLFVKILENVYGRIFYFDGSKTEKSKTWISKELKLQNLNSVNIVSNDDFNNVVMASFENFLTPTKLYLFNQPDSSGEVIKNLPPRFNSKNLVINQFEAKSKDGTMVPYFIIASKESAIGVNPTFAIRENRVNNPTLLYGYGGFQIAQTPSYSATLGKIWLENGGIYVLANIRGGGEFGPKWHKAAMLENRQKAYDDFIAVAEDLIAKKITTPEYLGIMGGSNGGLLVGATFTQRPELFKAVVCQVPLLDMIRYTKIGAGASWAGEYGDPKKPEVKNYILKYSPYQNLKEGVKYPKVLFDTSTLDDRVTPVHARKMAAKMEDMGNPIYFYEETEGGHGAAADNIQKAKKIALEYSYLFKQLGN